MKELDQAKELSGDLNAIWDKVVANTKGTPQASEAKKLAQVIEDLEMDIGRLDSSLGGGFRGKGASRLSQLTSEFAEIKVAIGYSDSSPYGQLQQIRRDLTDLASRCSHIDHPEARKVEKMLDGVRRYIYDVRE